MRSNDPIIQDWLGVLKYLALGAIIVQEKSSIVQEKSLVLSVALETAVISGQDDFTFWKSLRLKLVGVVSKNLLLMHRWSWYRLESLLQLFVSFWGD